MENLKSYNGISKDDQAILDLHNNMIKSMRSREAEILRFLGFLLPAVASFFAVGWLGNGETEYLDILLPSIFSVIIIILFFGAWYALALSYNFRYLQIVTFQLQEHLHLSQFQPAWKAKSINPINLPPEILKTQLWLFVTLIVVIAIVFTFYGLKICFHLGSYILVWVEVIISFSLLAWFSFEYRNKYHQRLKEVKDKEKND